MAALSSSRSSAPLRVTRARRVAFRRDVVASFPPVLDTNPYQRLLYGELVRQGFALAPSSRLRLGWLRRNRRLVGVLHFHWPQSYWRHARGPERLRGVLSYATMARFGVRLRLARALGYRIVWTVHQVYPHELASPRVDRLGALTLARLSDLLLVHDEATATSVERELGAVARKVALVPHGSYVGVYRDGRPREQVRAELGIPEDDFVFLCFGDLRAYKEVELLLSAFGRVSAAGVRLVVAGSVGSDRSAAAVRDAASADARVTPLLGFVPEERVAELFGAADAAVFARGDGGTSGALILALSLGVPAVVARTRTYVQLTGDGDAAWLFAPGDEASLAAALEAAAASGPSQRAAKAEAASRRAETLRWPEIGQRTAALIRGVTG